MGTNNFKFSEPRLSTEELLEFCAPFAHKLVWFATRPEPYLPHYYQQLFHCMHDEESHLLRFRHLVAGRRGGKTLSAAWELLYYCIHPEFFHLDYHGTVSDRPVYAWVLFKDNPTGKASWDAFRDVLKKSGLTHGVEYKENRTNRWFEFANGAFVHFRTAEDPQSLRGAGLDIMWIDEAAFIPSQDAWEVSRPALSDKQGMVMTTTTPSGKNWFWREFWQGKAATSDNQGRVEYRSIDNPFFAKEEWELLLETYHPMQFRQEFMASFDAFAGRELAAEWLHYYTLGKGDDKHIEVPRIEGTQRFDLKLFMGVDPAISLSDRADKFAMALIGVDKDSRVFLLETFASSAVPFPEQVDKIREWHIKYRPQLIGVESNAYQAALVQQVTRLEGLAPVVPIISQQRKKWERILGMAPLFKIGKVRIRETQKDFIDEWLDYDSQVKNPHDDLLDAVEIALQTAGALLPALPESKLFVERPLTLEELARADRPGGKGLTDKYGLFDEYLGGDW